MGRGSAWQMAGECNTSGTVMTADLRAVTPAGETQTGNAAAYKERVTKLWMPEWVPAWVYLDQLWATATAWAECGIVRGPLELRPGQSRVEHFAWYAGGRLSRDSGLWRPPFPGTASFTVEWPFLSRGDRPRISDSRPARTDPIHLQVPLTITGDGPGTPSLDELVDLALADPAWRAWVEADPSRNGWDRDYVRAHYWAGPDYPGPFLNTFDHPNGILELTLHQWLPGEADTVQGWILLDPWTGEVIHVRVPEWALTATPLPSPSPMSSPSAEPISDVFRQPGAERTPGGLAWQEAIEGPTQTKGTRFDELIAWSGGFAMLEVRRAHGDERRTVGVWRSADGRTWTRTALPALGGRLLGLVPYRDGLLIGVVRGDEAPRKMRVDIWRSPDAISWRRVGRIVGRVPAALPKPWWIEPGRVIVAGDRLGLIARLSDETGAAGWSPAGGQLARATPFAAKVPAQPDRFVGWTSATGARWVRARVEGVIDAEGQGAIDAVGQTPEAARALRMGATSALVESRDGTSWVEVMPLPAGEPWGPPQGLLWADGASVVYLDSYGPGGRHGNRLEVWRQEPHGRWTSTLEANPASAYGGAADAADVILVGGSSSSVVIGSGRADRPWGWGWVLVSRDGARTWDPDLSGSAAFESCFHSVAIHASTAVMLACNPNLSGTAPSTEVPAAWVADLPSASS